MYISEDEGDSQYPLEVGRKKMTILFLINIQVKKMKIGALLDSLSQVNLIVGDLVKKLGLETRDHLSPYPLGWVNKEVERKVTK